MARSQKQPKSNDYCLLHSASLASTAATSYLLLLLWALEASQENIILKWFANPGRVLLREKLLAPITVLHEASAHSLVWARRFQEAEQSQTNFQGQGGKNDEICMLSMGEPNFVWFEFEFFLGEARSGVLLKYQLEIMWKLSGERWVSEPTSILGPWTLRSVSVSKHASSWSWLQALNTLLQGNSSWAQLLVCL